MNRNLSYFWQQTIKTKKMKTIYKLSLVILAAGAISCSSDSDSSTGSGCNSDIAFFQTGKFEKYNLTQFGMDAGTMKLSFGDCTGSGLSAPMEFRNPAGTIIQTIQNKFWQDGAYLINDSGNDGVDLERIYKKGAVLNDTWTDNDADGAVITHTLVDMDSIVTVPAGTFHCKVIHYEKSDIINDSYIFWDDEVGQIMEDSGFIKIELTEYN
jgi:hypothetical protein